MPWSSKRFPDGLVVFGNAIGLMPMKEIFDAFAARNPGAAILSRIDADGSVILFFPPVAWEFGKMMGGTDCDAPPRENLTVLIGDASALEGLAS
jgi:hypothetical protein